MPGTLREPVRSASSGQAESIIHLASSPLFLCPRSNMGYQWLSYFFCWYCLTAEIPTKTSNPRQRSTPGIAMGRTTG